MEVLVVTLHNSQIKSPHISLIWNKMHPCMGENAESERLIIIRVK